MKPKLERQGQKFPGGLSDVVPVASELWSKMSTEEKSVYSRKAGRADGGAQSSEKKYDTRGVPLEWREKEQEKKSQQKVNSLQKVEDMIQYLATHGDLENQLFHFVHFNYAVETAEQEWPPCEVGLVKFSLLSGITDNYHQFINPGNLRIGYSYTAKEHSDATHKIPRDFKEGNDNYPQITNAIKAKLKNDDGGYYPVFYLEKDITKANYIFDWLIEKSCASDPHYEQSSPFRIYSLDKLFYELRRHSDLKNPRLVFPSMVIVSDALKGITSSSFDHHPNVPCQWHLDEDRSSHCSLTAVKRYAFVISDYCCKHFGLRLLPNRHVPAELDDTDKYEILPEPERRNLQMQVDSDDDNFEPCVEMESADPRLPRSLGNTVGSRLAAQFKQGDSEVGVGRGMLSALPSQSPEEFPAIGRGRGRGFLSF